jgi:hypothetical protein
MGDRLQGRTGSVSKSCEGYTASIVGREEEEGCVERRRLGRRRVVDDRVGGGEGGLSVGEERFVRSDLERSFRSACCLVATARNDRKA